MEFPLTAGEFAALQDAAGRAGLARGAYAAQVVLGHVTGSGAGPGAPDREALRELVRAAGLVHKIGVVGELLVHGFDVTRAAGLAWPVEPAVAALALAGEVQALPLLLDTRRAAGLAMRLKLHIRHGSPLVAVIRDDALRVEPPSSQPVDCHILVDPAAFLLVTFHRISLVSAVLTGKIIAWGRKPWLLPKFESALESV